MNLIKQNIGLISIIIAIILGGAMPPLIKIALKELPPEAFTFLRFVVSAFILLPIFLKSRIKLDRGIRNLIGASLFGSLNVILFAYGVKLTTASVSQALYLLVPSMVALTSYFILKDKIGKGKVLGILIGFLGASFLIILPFLDSSTMGGNILGNLLIIAAVVSFSFYSTFSKVLQKTYSPIQITMVYSFMTTLLTLLMSSKFVLNNPGFILSLSPATLVSVLYVGALGTAAYYLLYQYGIKHSSPTTASSLLLYLQPISVLIFSYFLIGERITPGFIVGAIIAVIGTTIVIRTK